jgi:hypothetical protein
MAKHLTDEELLERVAVYRACGNNKQAAARQLGVDPKSMRLSMKRAAAKGMLLDHPPAMPGFEITKVATERDAQGNKLGDHITQKREPGEVFQMPGTHFLGKMTVQRDAEGRVIQDWIRAMPDEVAREAAMMAAVAAFTAELPRVEPVILNSQLQYNEDLLNQYTVTDLHFGSLSWGEETGTDYDLKLAEQLLLDWFAVAIRMSPDAHTALLAQIGDLLHFDSLESVTPTSRHVIDADSRFAKIVRVVIRTLRRVIKMLLEKHRHVHIIMADANHDPASEIWLREMFSAFYENEPRLSVDRSPSTYYAYEWGDVALFYHHGHKRKVRDVDDVFVGKFRELYGKTKFAYAHLGHLHSDELLSTNLMKVERHETLAGRSSFEANGGWISERSAKVITYHKRFGHVGRIILTPEMVSSHDVATAA